MSTRECYRCHGRGEYATDLHKQPEHTKYPNPQWEPWEPDFKTCEVCEGRGVIVDGPRRADEEP